MQEPQRLPPAEPLFRMLALLGMLAMAGGTVYWLLVAGPTLWRLPSDDAHNALARSAYSRSKLLIALAVGVFGVASVAHLVLQTTVIHEVSLAGAFGRPLWDTLADTGWGRLWGWRMALAAAFAAVLFAPRSREGDGGEAGVSRWPWLAALAFSVGMMWTLSLASHGAATTGIRAQALFADFLHLAAAAFWVRVRCSTWQRPLPSSSDTSTPSSEARRWLPWCRGSR